MVGPTDDEGESSELPKDLLQRLLDPGVHRVQTRERGGNCWHEEPTDRNDYVETVIWATLLKDMSPTLEVRIELFEGVDEEYNQP